MRIQIVSDLHLEERPKLTFRELVEPAVAPILALLGDIAPLGHPNLRPFLEWCSEKWETVLWIPGCLELLGPDGTFATGGHRSGGGLELLGQGSGNENSPQPNLAAAVAKMRAIAEPFWNVHILDHEGMVSDDGIYIFGLPFWKFPRDEAPIWHPGLYRWVEAEPSPLPPAMMRRLYNEDIAWLRARTHAQKEPIVVLSHFGPTPWIQEEAFVGNPEHSVTFPDIEELLRPPIVAWLCGHCHQSVQFAKEWSDATGQKGNVLIATNPKGLPFENLEYRTDAVIRIDPSLYRI
jgi:hypothetical protein